MAFGRKCTNPKSQKRGLGLVWKASSAPAFYYRRERGRDRKAGGGWGRYRLSRRCRTALRPSPLLSRPGPRNGSRPCYGGRAERSFKFEGPFGNRTHPVQSPGKSSGWIFKFCPKTPALPRGRFLPLLRQPEDTRGLSSPGSTDARLFLHRRGSSPDLPIRRVLPGHGHRLARICGHRRAAEPLSLAGISQVILWLLAASPPELPALGTAMKLSRRRLQFA